ncbi:MAG TPA: phosphatase PAP2 family protein [Candidatus Lokiarchaeia archaeon]|nr:phosphatase PAP2 family protein [Candidatus Lokiarchaeia archaeon]
MEEPEVIAVSAPVKKAAQAQNAKQKQLKAKKKRMSFIVMSYLIALIIFAIGIIICSIGTGADSLDYQITMFFYMTLGGGTAANGPWYSFGKFFDPDPITDSSAAWPNLYLGQLFWWIVIIIVIILLIVSPIAYFQEKKKAKLENRKMINPEGMKYLKYALLVGLVALFIALLLTSLVKWVWGRDRPDTLFDGSGGVFMPWYIINGPISGERTASFWSGHAASGAFTTGIALGFVGSKRKWLSIVFGILTTFYTVCMALSRMVIGEHYFSDVLFGAFVTYTFVIIFYYFILDIPGQENIYRYELTFRPFNEGLKSVIDGKALLAENPEEAVAKVSSGLEKLSQAKTNAERITKNGHDFSQLVNRIDDLVGRLSVLMQEKPIDATKWSYIC